MNFGEYTIPTGFGTVDVRGNFNSSLSGTNNNGCISKNSHCDIHSVTSKILLQNNSNSNYNIQDSSFDCIDGTNLTIYGEKITGKSHSDCNTEFKGSNLNLETKSNTNTKIFGDNSTLKLEDNLNADFEVKNTSVKATGNQNFIFKGQGETFEFVNTKNHTILPSNSDNENSIEIIHLCKNGNCVCHARQWTTDSMTLNEPQCRATHSEQQNTNNWFQRHGLGNPFARNFPTTYMSQPNVASTDVQPMSGQPGFANNCNGQNVKTKIYYTGNVKIENSDYQLGGFAFSLTKKSESEYEVTMQQASEPNSVINNDDKEVTIVRKLNGLQEKLKIKGERVEKQDNSEVYKVHVPIRSQI